MTILIQPTHKITINVVNSKQITDMLCSPDYQDWISQSNYVKVNIISWDDISKVIQFLQSISEKRVLSLVLNIQIPSELLEDLFCFLDWSSYLSCLTMKIYDLEDLEKVLEYLDSTQRWTKLKSHRNCKFIIIILTLFFIWKHFKLNTF